LNFLTDTKIKNASKFSPNQLYFIIFASEYENNAQRYPKYDLFYDLAVLP